MRDFQKAKVYGAEFIFRDMLDRALESPQILLGGSTLVLPPEAKFSAPQTVQAYVNRVLSHPGVVERFGASQVSVRKRKGTTKAHYHMGVIAIPDDNWALRETVILHELAHHFSRGQHGPGFTAAFLELIGAVMGPQAQLVLRILYGDEGVK